MSRLQTVNRVQSERSISSKSIGADRNRKGEFDYE